LDNKLALDWINWGQINIVWAFPEANQA
jgi:hypothetical protein